MKTLPFLICLLGISFLCQSQTNDAIAFQYMPNEDSTVYRAIHSIFNSNQPISYFNAFLKHRYQLSHLEPLTSEEGKNGLLTEANIYLPFVLRRGRNFSPNWHQASRLTFEYWGQIRIAKDESSPILPPTNGFGIGSDIAIWDNFRDKSQFVECEVLKRKGIEKACKFDNRNFWAYMRNQTKAYQMLQITGKLMHYSNGQGSGFFRNDSIPLRNNYASGDFSTNYILLKLWYNRLEPNSRLYSASLGLRQEIGGSKGFMKISPGQVMSYGRTRIVSTLQYRSKPSMWWTKKENSVDCSNCTDFRMGEFFEYRLRAEFEYILGDVSRWRQGNFSNANRFNVHFYAELNPVRYRTIGFMFHYFYGRDYHNIRFDNVVHTFQFGITLNFNKYMPILTDFAKDAVQPPFTGKSAN